ncbi:nucleoside-diphosphate-sugar epimerase [Albidovulum inexpectatum]|uniref:Nucleoside-diphosphate-sugar epimerase n=1 Tax=Albidovulum inexpectatum TaxID=196587 RepID=A0A2S5JJE5_9RHOB|nr:NAD(P)-dependent oxidoreductase [Albidovulum inexpectatum]PPB81572.1 nucleoside-diphosphate-sugar epimerase [Albidovulum inexpectatum]
MTSRRILVTGASGLIGRAVMRPLQRLGYDVVGLSRSGDTALRGHLLRDPEAAAEMAQADTLLHLAWADGPHRMNDVANLNWVIATLRLLQAFAANGGKRAVLVGSCAEYDWALGGRFSEDSPLRPASVYGAAKAATGLAAMGAADALGVSLAWARPFFVYGAGEAEGRLLGDLVRGFRAGATIACSDGRQRRDYLHVDDLALALTQLLQSSVEGAVNIGSGRAIEVRELVLTAARLAGCDHLVHLGERPRPPGDPDVIEADIARLRDATGFEPRYDLESGLAAALREEGLA